MKKILIMVLVGLAMQSGVSAKKSLRNDHMYAVILAGGSGERLWPLSRTELPKQLLSISGSQTLLDQAIDRVAPVIVAKNIWVSTTYQHATNIHKAVGDKIGSLLVEPGSRNTGPAILYCCMKLYEQDPEAVVAFLPADPYIPATEHFAAFLEHALDYARNNDRIALFGIKPRYPATGYGYIECGAAEKDGLFVVEKFHEKPSHDVAEAYVAAGNMLWNAGIFCGKVKVFLDEYKRLVPAMYEVVERYTHGCGLYDSADAISVDYAIMEKSTSISVLPVDFSWCDVGNVDIFLSLKAQSRGRADNVVTVNADNNLVDAPGKLVALVGVHDLCIVDTGDTLLVVKRQDAEKVKMIVQALKQMQAHEYL